MKRARDIPEGLVLPPAPRCLICGVPRFPPFAEATTLFLSPCTDGCVYRTGALADWLRKWPPAATHKAVAYVKRRRPFKRPVALLAEGPEEL